MKTLLLTISLTCIPWQAQAEALKHGPFRGLDTSLVHKDFRTILNNANEDFWLMQQGKAPIHAKRDGDGHMNDGGTHGYKAAGYKILLKKSLTNIGGVNGLIYGPILSFDKNTHWRGNSKQISATRFLSLKQYRALQKKK